MTNDVIREVERYADALETATPNVAELLPWVYDAEPPVVTLSMTDTASRRPILVVAAAIAVVAVLAVPLWLMALDRGDPSAPPETPTTTVVPDESPANDASGQTWPNAYIGIDAPWGTVNGEHWAPNSEVRVTLNGASERLGRTDASGTFVLPSIYAIDAGDVVSVTVDGWTKTIIWRSLTLDIFDRTTGTMSGLADFPDGTEIAVTVAFSYAEGDVRAYSTTSRDGRWSLTIGEPLGPESSAAVNTLDPDGDNYGWYRVPGG